MLDYKTLGVAPFSGLARAPGGLLTSVPVIGATRRTLIEGWRSRPEASAGTTSRRSSTGHKSFHSALRLVAWAVPESCPAQPFPMRGLAHHALSQRGPLIRQHQRG